MDMNEFKTRLVTTIHEQGAGCAALFEGFCTAELKGGSLVFREIFGSGGVYRPGEEFAIDDVWEDRKADLVAWFDDPDFCVGLSAVGGSMQG